METGDHLNWRTSGGCDSGTCVEVAITRDRVFLRRSTDPDGPRLAFTRRAWTDFLDSVRSGQIDR